MGRDKFASYAAPLVGGVLALLLIAYIASTIRSFRRPALRSNSATANSPADWKEGGGIRRVQLKPAVPFDVYEHALENVPLRGDTSGRELDFRAPRLPVSTLRDTLYAKSSTGNSELLAWVQEWQVNVLAGRPTTSHQLTELESLLRQASLSPETLLDVARAVTFLDDQKQHGIVWIRGALSQAEREHKGLSPEDPSVKRLLDLLAQTAVLWRVNDHESLRRRFALEKTLRPQRSPQAYRARFLHAQMLYYTGQYLQAEDELAPLHAEQRAMFEAGGVRPHGIGPMDVDGLHVWDFDPLQDYEFDLARALALFGAERYDDAARHFERCVVIKGGPHEQMVFEHLIRALVGAEQLAKAEERMSEYVSRFQPSKADVRRMTTTIESQKLPVESR
jgi:tetratricopeptide (TPR) repeat protein